MNNKPKIISSIVVGTGGAVIADYAWALLTQSADKILPVLKHPLAINPTIEWIKTNYLMNPPTLLSSAFHSAFFVKTSPIIFGYFAYLTLRRLWQLRSHRLEDASDYGAYGDNRWAKPGEIFPRINLKREQKNKEKGNQIPPVDITSDLESEGPLLAALNGKPIILRDESWKNKHVAVFGGSGAGKTDSYVVTNILNTRNKSIVVPDPKGELYEKTSEVKRKQGYKVHLINFTDPDFSDRYNPFSYIKKDTDALKIAKTIIMNSVEGVKKTDFWDKAEAALLSSFILYIKHERPAEEHNFASVFDFACATYKRIHAIFRKLPDTHIARKAYEQAIAKLESKVRANVFISLLVTLDLWKYKSIRDFTSTSDFDFQSIGKEKSIVYMMLPIGDETFRPLISTFFTQMFDQLYDLANQNFNRLPIKVRFILDEFNNIGKIPRYEEILSTSRSYGIEISMIIQSIGQLRDRFGDKKADEIIDNCHTRLFLGSSAPDSLKYFSDMLGYTTGRIQNQSESIDKYDKKTSSGKTWSVIRQELQTPDQLARLNGNKAIVFIDGKYPILADKAWYHSFEKFKSMLGPEVSRYDHPIVPRDDYQVFNPKSIKFDNDKELDEEEEDVVKRLLKPETKKKTKIEKQKEDIFAT